MNNILFKILKIYTNNIKMVLFISPPFGNYINFPNTTSIRGSFTLNERPGKWLQIIKTLRYNFVYGNNETFIKQIKFLEASTYILIRGDKLYKKRYWSK